MPDVEKEKYECIADNTNMIEHDVNNDNICTWVNEKNNKNITMKLKHVDLEAILTSFWVHLGVPGRPLGLILGVLGATWNNVNQSGDILEAI